MHHSKEIKAIEDYVTVLEAKIEKQDKIIEEQRKEINSLIKELRDMKWKS